MQLRFLVVMTGLAAAQSSPGPSAEVMQRGVYLGRGPEETGVVALDPRSQLFAEQVRAVYRLEDYGWSPEREPAAGAAERFFDAAARDYDSYLYMSSLIRQSHGQRVNADAKAVTPLAYLRDLALAMDERGRPLLVDRRVEELLVGLVDSYPVREGLLSACRADVDLWLGAITGVDGDRSALVSALRQAPDLRALLAATPPAGCTDLGRFDFVFMRYGVVTHSGQGWLVLAVDYSLPRREEGLRRVVPFEQLAGTGDYCAGEFDYRVDPDGGTITLDYGYKVDLAAFPEALATRYHEQILTDLIFGMHELVLRSTVDEAGP